MNQIEGKSEFNILGYRVVFQPEKEVVNYSPESVVNFVQNEANVLKERMPHLEPGQLAILLALKFAKENLDLKMEFKENINELHNKAKDALQCLEGISSFS